MNQFSPQAIALFLVAVACPIASQILRSRMATQVNQQPAQEPKFTSLWWWTGTKVRALHAAYRRFYPTSNLTTVDTGLRILGLVLFVVWLYLTRRHGAS
jgi:molybdopterin-guanine dinucleotide biosynthesis protein A